MEAPEGESKEQLRPNDANTVSVFNDDDDDNDDTDERKSLCHHHKSQRQRYFNSLTILRSHRSCLQSKGVEGFALFEQMATAGINYRIHQQRKDRCPNCWCDKKIICLCQNMPTKLRSTELPAIKFLLLMHHKEFWNAGNSAKVLLALLPEKQIQLFVYGRVGDFDQLVKEITMDPEHTMVLWPGRDSQTMEEFTNGLPEETVRKIRHTNHQHQPTTGSSIVRHNEAAGVEGKDRMNNKRELVLRVVVLDGTYTNARNMHKTLKKRLQKDNHHRVTINNVALHPTELSRFHRARKRYSDSIVSNLKANPYLDKDALRISTAEACGLLLTELGADTNVQERILEAVLLNNNVVRATDGGRVHIDTRETNIP